MKRLLIASSVFLVIGVLSACSVKEGFQGTQEQVTQVGLLVEQTTQDKESGTHFVVNDKGQKSAVRSLTINLSGNEYLNNKVRTVGLLNQSDNVLEITGLSVEEILPKSPVVAEVSDDVMDATVLEADVPKIDMTMTVYESLPYQFSGQYPSKWYYAGVKGASDSGVLHHYGFSDKVLDGRNEILGLDVLGSVIPAGGNKISFAGKNFDVFEEADFYAVYITLKNKNLRLKGPLDYKELILYMAAAIMPVNKP